ncbi:MAG: class I SAM-dependent methyltransferase [Phycisphaerales bacterium]
MQNQVVDARCTACGSTAGVELIRLKDGAYRQCSVCGLIFTSAMPEDLKQFNEDVFTGRLEYYAAKIHTQDRHYRKKLRQFGRYRRTGNLLEIGCNAGAALDVARRMGWNVKGVELCASAGSFARERLGLDVFTGTVEAAAFPDDSFDVVFTNAVLEHLCDPLSVLRECRRILRPGGVFYANTVNWDSLTRRLLGPHWEYLEPRGHVHLYTPRNVRSLCDRADLKHVRTWSTGVRVHPRSANGFDGPWCWRLFKGPLMFVARWTNTGDHIEFLAMKPAGEPRTA